jgi:hypothetical protein
MTMDEATIEAFDQLITLEGGSTSFHLDDIPETLHGSNVLVESLRPPTRCPLIAECREHCEYESDEDTLRVTCDDGHDGQVPITEYLYIDIEFERLLEKVSEHLGYEIESIDTDPQPRYIIGHTRHDFEIYLIISPSDYEKTVNEICMKTLIEDRPALLITPEDTIDTLLEIQSLFAAGNLIYTTPFTMLAEREEIRHSMVTIDQIQDVEQQVLRENIEEQHPVVYRVNSNPRYILTELNQMRLLRLAGELPQSSGTRLEKIGESTFSHLFAAHPEAGGEDDRGSNLPDSVFYISDQTLPSSYDSVLGIVDTKSGDDAGFGSEPIEGKHDEYLERGRRQAVPADLHAHIFVILGFDGQQELSFYDGMKDYYQDNEYMVIFTAEALALVMSAYLSHTVANELTLIDGNFRTAIYPFFHRNKFREAGLASITRDVGRKQEKYDQKYMQREGLLIVFRDVVKQRLQDCMESPGEIENLLSTYYQPMPRV